MRTILKSFSTDATTIQLTEAEVVTADGFTHDGFTVVIRNDNDGHERTSSHFTYVSADLDFKITVLKYEAETDHAYRNRGKVMT